MKRRTNGHTDAHSGDRTTVKEKCDRSAIDEKAGRVNGHADGGDGFAVAKTNDVAGTLGSAAAKRLTHSSAVFHGPNRNEAASDDASGVSAACAAPSVAAGADRDACAEVAKLPTGRERTESDATAKRSNESATAQRPTLAEAAPCVPSEMSPSLKQMQQGEQGGEVPLPDNPSDFVDEIHRQIDLFERWVGLLKSEDEKIRQRAVERLTDMKYKGAPVVEEEPRQLFIDMPRPVRN